MSPYSVHPMEQQFQEWDIKFKEKRMRYWSALKTAHTDYEQNENHGYYEPTLTGFRHWMESRWGVRVEIVDGNIGSNFTVVDEPKYVLFTLKYLK